MPGGVCLGLALDEMVICPAKEQAVEKKSGSEVGTPSLSLPLKNDGVTFGQAPHLTVLHPHLEKRHLDLILSFPLCLDGLCFVYDVFTSLLFFPFSHCEGKAKVVTSRKTAPSRVFQRRSCVEAVRR